MAPSGSPVCSRQCAFRALQGGRRVASASSSVKPLERVRCGLTVLPGGDFFQPPRLVGHPEDHLDDRQVFLADHVGGKAFSWRSWPHQSAMFSGATRYALSWPGWSIRLSILWQKSPTVRRDLLLAR